MKLYGLKYINVDDKGFILCCEPHMSATNDYSHEVGTSYEFCSKEEIQEKDKQVFLSANKESLKEENIRDLDSEDKDYVFNHTSGYLEIFEIEIK